MHNFEDAVNVFMEHSLLQLDVADSDITDQEIAERAKRYQDFSGELAVLGVTMDAAEYRRAEIEAATRLKVLSSMSSEGDNA